MLEKYSQGEISQAGLIDDEKRDNSLVILAFPTNDFHQEPGTNEEIEDTVKQLLGEQYDNENFVLFHKSKLEHNPIYKMLKRHMPDSEVKHNFYKYIIGRDGVPIAFYKKSDTLLDMESAIINELETI